MRRKWFTYVKEEKGAESQSKHKFILYAKQLFYV